jgi:predicted nucleotide-binding protein
LARIHPEILEKIQRKLAIGERQAYDLIARKVRLLHLPRHIAALAVAAENGLNISKKAYATDEDRGQLRSATVALPKPVSHGAGVVDTPPPPRKASARKTARRSQPNRTVLVVHGRNGALRNAMFSFLRALSLEPIEWTTAIRATKKGSPYVGEVLDAMFAQAAAVVVILSPDDEARLKKRFRKPTDPSYEKVLSGQARPNVLFEAGRAFGVEPKRTILVQVGDVRPFSDTQGRHAVRMTNTTECRQDLALRLETAGCAVKMSGTDWHSAGDFDAAE